MRVLGVRHERQLRASLHHAHVYPPLVWALLHVASDGNFTATLALLARPDTPAAIFDAWRSFSITGAMFEELGVDSYLSWNLWIHVAAFRDATVLVLVLGLLGAASLPRAPEVSRRDRRLLRLQWC